LLKTYAEKRNFDLTPEPKPTPGKSASHSDALTFVIQKHAASHLHYDFRLELNGALVSWAVPKGPSLNPKQRRLAAKVEDHPLDYGGFEGMIPQGEYGGGEVIVWDRGTYETQKAPLDRVSQERELNLELERGKLEFVLHGEKLKGGWVLIRTQTNQWLLMKRNDDFASETDILAQDQSVITGHRIGGVVDVAHSAQPVQTAIAYRPMLLAEIEKPFRSPDWQFELKMDGVRAIVSLDEGRVLIRSRNDNDVTSRFPKLLDQIHGLPVESAVFDGEIVQFDSEGHPDFQGLIQPFQAGHVTEATYCIFDILSLNGEDLTKKPLGERRAILDSVDLDRPLIRRLDVFPEDGNLLFQEATRMGFEGIVGKRLDSAYAVGERSDDWVKIKCYHSEEFLVVGYTRGLSARSKNFGALVLAQQGPSGLVYSGNVGGGFSHQDLESITLELQKRKTAQAPIRYATRPTDVTWIDPLMIAEVRFMTRTKEGRLRFPIFQRLRPDLWPAAPTSREPVKEDLAVGALAQLEENAEEIWLESNGQKIHFSHLGKELWPGVTKRDLARYYATASESLLTYLKDRPLSFVRCPDGVEGERFFQKHWDKGRPDYVETVSIHSDSNGGARDFLMCNNLETLLWLAQMGAVELNPWNSRISPGDSAGSDFASSRESLEESVLNQPDYLVFDLDPHFGGKATGWRKPEWDLLVEVALTLKEILAQLKVVCSPKSSGKSGLHLYVPVSRQLTYDQIRAAAGTFGQEAVKLLGKKVTLEWNVKKRPDGVFIDVNQNVRGKTMAAPYSPRAALVQGVSMPLLWDELSRVDPTQFTVLTAPERLATKGDLWAETLGLHQSLLQ
jgi:bifunctional non-homologous end joining protein LigD